MLAEDLPGEGYAQIGLMRNDTDGGCHCERYFWEYNVDGLSYNGVRAVWGTPTIVVGFRVDLQGDGKIHMFYDTDLDGGWELPPANQGGQTAVTPWQPSQEWPGGQVPIFSEELTYAQSSYKGTSGNRTSFYFLQMREAAGSWVETDLEDNDPVGGVWVHYDNLANKGFTNVESDTSMEIWN
jgi:hypothetical protein